MKINILSKHLQHSGNLGFVQFSTLTGDGFGFLPAGPVIESGKLLLKEVVNEGMVNTILAVNETADFLLLTDLDILKGARQNRVVNLSVLLAPMSKTEIDVSCIERGRWSYNSPTFSLSPQGLDSALRYKKTSAVRETAAGRHPVQVVQHNLWANIYEKVARKDTSNRTEDYESFLEKERKRKDEFGSIQPIPECNGLAVIVNHHILAVDLFGNREAYSYYFPKLVNANLGLLKESNIELNEAEAFYKLDDLFDRLEFDEEVTGSGGAGIIKMSVNEDAPGFELSYKDQPVHMAVFVKND